MSYKVVNEDSLQGVNITSCRMIGAFKVHYRLNKWVEPEYGPALVFDTLEHARAFIIDCGVPYDIIYRCKTRQRNKVSIVLFHVITIDQVHLFWASPQEGHRELVAPPGTFAAKQVMLTKRIGPSLIHYPWEDK